MSSMGISPLAIYDPQTYQQQIAIQRRQALAQSLMQQGEGNAGSGQYGGLRNAGNTILGAFLAKRADRDLGNLYNPMGGGSPGQVSNAPTAGGTPSPQAMGAALTGNTPPAQPTSSQPQQATIGPVGDRPADYGSLPAQAQRIYDQIPHISGMPARQAINYFMSNPQGYQAEWAKQFEATDMQKNTSAAYGAGTPEAQAMMRGTLGKGAVVNIRPGGGAYNMANDSMITMPGANGVQSIFPNGASGGAVQQMAPGAFQAQQQATAATGLGKAATTPAIGYDGNNQPVATNQGAMLGNPMIPGVNPQAVQQVESGGNPNAVSPAGAVGPMQTMPGTLQRPGFGVAPAQAPGPQEQGRVGTDYLSAMQTKYQNPVLAHIAYNMGPGATDKWLASGGDFSKLPDETQKYLGRIAVSQAMQGRQQQQAPQQGSPRLLPELPQGTPQYLQSQGKDAAERHDSTVAAASESPMRINVLDNIIGLSKQGVATGPGQEWQNSILGYAANLPGLSKVMGSQKDNVGRFQELQKFTYQNAIRSWQAAGGTGTDAQMQSMAHANPNDHLFPQALQTIAQWGKAAELAVQGKANAQDRFLSQNGQSPSAQIKFENTWRNNFDPKVFQYSLMSPQEKQVFAQHELKTPQAAQAFIAKQKQLQSMGALQ